ncbi:(2Fe-2S)-binding protein [Alicyclobacillus acidoterrestris]|uniref:2Fe-2S iron-sulfur cluster-binding protein n=1 Tax=Alicyclobacillus acidoterrestris (strain ATCC 49025 / DSM 3922 / CIP 106132 / NCIMB 13137 / GD3B) TaxID=1356854 RepID=T0DTV8_ALIAG|nr:2Fe-2S iron-sulfur cluster-binding protein [Alicyclobacillus acidoterrestris]EPZ52901.1 hypothetical protein N007_02025 [Alicyclobacillus acidoterrestris ATCC 49025]UNO49113.1 2Fe-2S iron-sulfur cluster-binding protein [Alicyclobacillus acidoterrestris]
MQEQRIILNINGEEKTWMGDPTTPLADVIREHFQLTVTKVGCRTGECGACTIILDGAPMNSCILPVAMAENSVIQTIEGLADDRRFQLLVTAMAEEGGAQCGFCTPGIMMTLWASSQASHVGQHPDYHAILKNNLCRCTGYQSILAAAKRVLGPEVNVVEQ